MTATSRLLAAGLAALAPTLAAAQAYPVKPVRMVVPFSPGGATDILARLIGGKLQERLGQSVVIDNRAGGGGHIGAELVAKAPPDGYTLLTAGVPQAIGMSLFKKLNYDMAKDLAPITNLATFPSVIAVHPSLPIKTVKDLIALARARPGELNFGANPGSPNHLAIELVNVLAGVKMVHIGYKGSGPVVTDLIGGQIQLASLGLPPAMPHVQSGRLRALAVTGIRRSALLPNVPTVDESGIKGFDVTSWYGLFGPPALPATLIARLNSESRAGFSTPDVKERLDSLGAEVALGTPEEFGRLVREEIARWAKVVKASGATPE